MPARRMLLLGVALLAAAGPARARADDKIVWQHDSSTELRGPGTLGCAGGTVTPQVGAAEISTVGGDFSAGGSAYVRAPLSIAGSDGCLAVGGLHAQIEVIPPPRAHLVDWHEPGITCSAAGQPEKGCAVSFRTGTYGGVIVDDMRSGTPGPWPVSGTSDQPTYVEIPITYEDFIDSFNKPKSPEKRCAPAAPCPPDQANGRAQIVVTFVPGTNATPAAPTLATVGMLPEGEVDCCEPSSDGPSGIVIDQGSVLHTTTFRLSQLKGHGVRFNMEATRGTTGTLKLLVKGRTVATATATATKTRTLHLYLQPSAKERKRLRGRTTTGTVTLTRTDGRYSPFALRWTVKIKG